MEEFSSIYRQADRQRLATETFDLLIIGGGITGAGIALDAASRGLKVALVEKNDFASGTSSRSTKLIHGGLRYLKQLEVGLVMETGREREVLHRNCPHLIVPEKMLLPLIKNGTYGSMATSFGLWVYDVLAGVKDDEQRQMLNAEQTAAMEPLLRRDVLEGGGLYIEYRTDDARLTIEVLKTAANFGALALNYTQATGFLYNAQGKINGVHLHDLTNGEQYTAKAHYVVNAAGPWVDDVRHTDTTKPNTNKHLRLTKGVHLVVPRHRLPITQAVYFDIPDGRMMFAIPRAGVTYLGTTDTNYQADINQPRATAQDVDYLLKATNWMFPSAQLTPADVVSSWAGLRPLIHEEGKSPSELSRKDEIFVSEGGLLSIAGGKLTGFRKMAERVTNRVAKALARNGQKPAPCVTDRVVLCGGAFGDTHDVHQYVDRLAKTYPNTTKNYLEYLVFNVGSNTPLVLDKMKEYAKNGDDEAAAGIRAELWYCFHHEMIQNLTDFFVRRTGRLYFQRESIAPLLAIAADELSWLKTGDGKLAQRLMDEFAHEYEAVVSFEPALAQAATA